MAVLFETSVGDIVFDLYCDQCPKACENFLKLCKVKYYNNCLFYSVEKDFITRSGDPTNTGKGGECIYSLLRKQKDPSARTTYFDTEIVPELKHDKYGVLAMVTSAKNENGSQFYVTLRDSLSYLDRKHTVFGCVSEGLDILKSKVNATFVDDANRPIQNIRIRHTIILDDPFPDPEGLSSLIPDASPAPIIDDEYTAFENEEDQQKIAEQIAKNEAKSRAVALEILGDVPDADMKPPDNVLFVCKLNPNTEDDDLELIFSRSASHRFKVRICFWFV
jgi:peptidyl-prolyl cis-trans isomerase-like 4